MAVQEGRSKDRVVRLEPFFTDAPVAALDRPVTEAPDAANPREFPRLGRSVAQAARVAGRVAAAVDSNRTLTRFETPDSSIVTP
jgi:hypothetical protein